MRENRSVPKRGRVLLRLNAAVLVLLVICMMISVRTYDVITAGAQALWSQNELYIFVEQNKVAWSENVWSFVWHAVRLWLTAPSPPTFHRIDCTVYHITSDSIHESQAKGWHVAGSVAPYKGVPHAFIGGGPDTRGIYRWTGNGFERLSPSETLAVDSGYTDEFFKREGWSGVQFLLPRGTADHNISLDGIRFTVHVTHTDDGTTEVELIRRDDPQAVRLLYHFKDHHSGFLSTAEYGSFV